MKVLVTGGSGLIGSALRALKPEWIYLSSKDCNLLNEISFGKVLENEKPETVIHLAANVGGLFKNEAQRLTMYEQNFQINYNVITNCYKRGIKRVICCLSTCVFPDGLNRIMNETDLHLGEPHESNFGYAYAKRMMEVHCRLINQNKDYNYQCIAPTNIYGENDNFHLENSHVIPGLIHKAYIHSKIKKESTFIIKGDGTPLRQFIYSHDLAKIIIHLIEKNDNTPVVICSPSQTETVSILDIAKIICDYFNIVDIQPENKAKDNGQQIKTVSNDVLMKIMPDMEFKDLYEGIHETCNWFVHNFEIARK